MDIFAARDPSNPVKGACGPLRGASGEVTRCSFHPALREAEADIEQVFLWFGCTLDAAMRLAEVLGCLSLGTDITDGFRMEKAMRTAVLASALAERIEASEATRSAAYWAALVRFIGCTAFAPEEASLYGAGDDIALRAALARVDFGSVRDFVARALPQIGVGAPTGRRITALARLLGDPSAPRLHAEAQCEVGVQLARELALGEEVERALDLREERYDARGPRKLGGGDALPLAARIVDVADVAELFHCEGGEAAAVAHVKARRGGQLDPVLVDAFVAESRTLLLPLDAPSIFDVFLEAEGDEHRRIDADGLRRVARAYAHVVDLKSFFTGGHSTGTAALVERACEAAGVSPHEREQAVVAALLHDVGNLALPGGILDKPGPLTRWERERVRGHAAHTAVVLYAAPCMTPIADIACAAHEYGGGDGYPRAAGPASLPLTARIVMAADVYHALREPRAHRPAYDGRSAERVLSELSSTGRLCARAVRAVLEAAGHRVARRGPVPRGLSEREIEVLRLVAIGRTNKEVGALLGVSARTAQKHVSNVYDKLGVSSRAAAALFAAEHGLLEPDAH